MEMTYTVYRKKSVSIKSFLLMLFTVLLFGFFAFVDVRNLGMLNEEDELIKYYILKVLSILLFPIVTWCMIYYLKNIFDKNPILNINEKGLTDRSNVNNFLGTIKWYDIERTHLVPYMNGLYFICIHLKKPEKYFKKKGLFSKMTIKKKKGAYGHLNISSMYFKNEVSQVYELICYYIGKSNEEYFE